MARHVVRLEVGGEVELVLPDGTSILVFPAHNGGLGVGAAASTRASGKVGRPPSPTTIRLREQMRKDGVAGLNHTNAHYIKWLMDDIGCSLVRARQLVTRESRHLSRPPLPSA